MELLALANIVLAVALGTVIANQSKRLTAGADRITELEQENAYLNDLMHTPFDQMEFSDSRTTEPVLIKRPTLDCKPAKRKISLDDAVMEAWYAHRDGSPGLTA